MDTFGEIGFGYRIDSLIEPIPFSSAFDWVIVESNSYFRNPLKKFLNKSKMKANLLILEDFVYKIIDERRAVGYEGKNDYLSNLLRFEASGEATGVTNKFLRDQLMNFFIAGRDTTAILLSWTFYFLSLHPDVDKKVREEILEVLGNEKPTLQTTKQLKYLQKVLDESLRLYPPAVPFSNKQATRDLQLPNGARVFSGQIILYSPYVIHRLPEYWGPDANEFRPDRWDIPLKHKYQFVPFQKGPRVCLGMNMAYEEAKCCIAMLVQRGIKFEFVKGQKVIKEASAIVMSRNGILMNVLRGEQ